MKRLTTQQKKAHILELLNNQVTTCKEAIKENNVRSDPWYFHASAEWNERYKQIIKTAQACIRWIEKQ